ncbi:hypothetical protein CAG70_03085 [Photobacterium halotolerans]|uniref:hypothetical protein n=1 Tax=Photobacterium halotolerans TaxID=265726 RepID=UPI001372DB61|nr:hypothetical protein [Photobacterium halotolerans]NAX45987.1 hypothetical protein [Photobacterium halotolerans]
MKNKKLSIWFETAVVLLLSGNLIGFGILIGSVNLSDLANDIKWTDILSSAGSIMAGVGTIATFVVALYALKSWKHEFKWKDLYGSYLALDEALGTYYATVRNFVNANLCEAGEYFDGITPNHKTTQIAFRDWNCHKSETYKALDRLNKLQEEKDAHEVYTKIIQFDAIARKALSYSNRKVHPAADYSQLYNESEEQLIELEKYFFETKKWMKQEFAR